MRVTLILIWLCIGWGVQAQQTDTLRTEITEEADSLRPRPTRQFVKVYRKFIRAQVEEKTLIKLGATPIFGYAGYVGPVYGIRSELAVERKLVPAVSVMGALRMVYSHLGNFSEEISAKGLLGARWYYAQNNRIRAGKSANNFSNQYVTIQVSQPLLNQARLKTTGERYAPAITGGIGIGWGAQRRLGRLGYLDWNIGPAVLTTQKPTLTINTSLYIGLGL